MKEELSKVRYGRVEKTTTLDDNGSEMIESATLHNYNKTDVKTRFEMRVRVHNEKEVLQEFLKFRAETASMAKAEFRIEHTAIGNEQGFFYVVKCWTEVNK